jgi:ectoine hydroxylase-related dioxygenase (phytanoyl-CoA dioxygenase family)
MSAPQADLVSKYDKDGYIILKNVIDEDLAMLGQDHVRWLLEKNPDLRPEQLHHHLAIKDPFWYRLVADPRLLDAVQPFLGPNIALFATHYICKPPGDGQPVLWHQDGSYWPLDPMEVTTIWLSLGHSTRKNGCMRVIPGTQDTDLQEMKLNTEVDNVLSSSIDDSFVDETNAVDIELGPGDLSIHHPNVIHGSDGNTSDQWRFGLTIRYIPTTTKITVRDAGSPFLLRGNPVPGINEYHPIPECHEGDFLPFPGCESWPPAGPGNEGWSP